MKWVRSVAVLAVWCVALGACGSASETDDGVDSTDGSQASTPSDGSEPADRSPDGSWVLTSGTLDGEPIVMLPEWQVTLTIDGDQVGGTAACNSYGGTVSIGDEFDLGGSFAVGELSWTEMGCEPAVMDLEQTFLAALQAVDSYELAADLALAETGAGTSLLFEPLASVDDAAIVGTTWVLDTVIQGDVATNSPLMSSASLALLGDGTLTGSTSCRRMEGEWVESGAEILFTSFTVIDDPTAGECAPESIDLENTIVSVLGDGFTPTVEGDRLTLTSQGGDGLSYVAETG